MTAANTQEVAPACIVHRLWAEWRGSLFRMLELGDLFVKCLLCKHEDQSAVLPGCDSTWKKDRSISGAFWLSSLAETVCSRFSEWQLIEESTWMLVDLWLAGMESIVLLHLHTKCLSKGSTCYIENQWLRRKDDWREHVDTISRSRSF